MSDYIDHTPCSQDRWSEETGVWVHRPYTLLTLTISCFSTIRNVWKGEHFWTIKRCWQQQGSFSVTWFRFFFFFVEGLRKLEKWCAKCAEIQGQYAEWHANFMALGHSFLVWLITFQHPLVLKHVLSETAHAGLSFLQHSPRVKSLIMHRCISQCFLTLL